jgi:hypothetical protein
MSDPIAAYAQSQAAPIALITTTQFLAAIMAGPQGPIGPRNSSVTVDATDDLVMASWTTYKADDPDDVVLFNLPLDASSNVGDQILILGYGLGGWKIAQRLGEQILISGSISGQATTAGTGGYLYSTHANDDAILFKIAPNVWKAQTYGCNWV